MLIWKGKPDQLRYVLSAWASYVIGTFMMLFVVFWFCLVVKLLHLKYFVQQYNISAFIKYFAITAIFAIVFITLGLSLSLGVYKKIIKNSPTTEYELTEETIKVTSIDKVSILKLSDIKEVYVVRTWAYFSKEYGDVYFKTSEKEILTYGLNAIVTRREIPKALGVVAIKNPEELADKAIFIINKNRGTNMKYTII